MIRYKFVGYVKDEFEKAVKTLLDEEEQDGTKRAAR